MNHDELLLLYAADQLDKVERAHFEVRLAGCVDCQTDLKLWSTVSDKIIVTDTAVPVPPCLAESALEVIHRRSQLSHAFARTIQLLRAQAFLVHREMFPASATVMALGMIVALLSNHLEVYISSPR